MTENEISRLQSGANSWNSFESRLDKLIKNDPRLQDIKNEVSNQLFRDNCHSAVSHRIEFIERLIELLADAEER